MAVRAGFEPAVPLRVRQFSKLVVSATHPPHQDDLKYLQLHHHYRNAKIAKVFAFVKEKEKLINFFYPKAMLAPYTLSNSTIIS